MIKIKQVRIEVVEADGDEIASYSFPIHCPKWLLWILSKLEI
jgi:hypothetical protein